MNCNNNKKYCFHLGMCAAAPRGKRSCPGGLGSRDPAAVLHCECSSGWLQGEESEGGEKEEQCSALDASQNQGYHHSGLRVLVGEYREEEVSFLMFRNFLFQRLCCCWRAVTQRLCLSIHFSQCMLHWEYGDPSV